MDKQDKIMELIRSEKTFSQKFHLYERQKREYVQGHPLYMREADFLEFIADEPKNMGSIAEEMNITMGAVSQIALRLENRGYIKRVKNKNDKRIIRAEITRLGKEMVKAHDDYESPMYTYFFESLGKLTEEQLEFLDTYVKYKTTWVESHLDSSEGEE